MDRIADEKAIETYIHNEDYYVEEEAPKYHCSECKEEIYELDYYWNIDGHILCEDCVDSLYRFQA
ncbi:MAG: hypothetical protein MJ197_10130 [Bacteroidales bacterium]|nr:hypothetical protein [Bacteroidales bacterium]